MTHLLLTINGNEITNHGREASFSEDLNVNDIETSGGRVKRFFKSTKRNIDLTFTYLPGPSLKTIDGRQGRDFISNLAYNNPLVLVSLQDEPSGSYDEFYAYISSYSEKIVRRDLKSQCIYYDISLTLEEK